MWRFDSSVCNCKIGQWVVSNSLVPNSCSSAPVLQSHPSSCWIMKSFQHQTTTMLWHHSDVTRIEWFTQTSCKNKNPEMFNRRKKQPVLHRCGGVLLIGFNPCPQPTSSEGEHLWEAPSWLPRPAEKKRISYGPMVEGRKCAEKWASFLRMFFLEIHSVKGYLFKDLFFFSEITFIVMYVEQYLHWGTLSIIIYCISHVVLPLVY